MGKSTALWGREAVLGGVAIAVLAMLINTDIWDGSSSKTLQESNKLNNLAARISSRAIKSRVCLNMIAKDEAKKLLVPALKAAALHVTGYMLCDTGSTDGTPNVTQSTFDRLNITGAIEHHEWKDFSSNRNMCIESGQRLLSDVCDYWLLLDADQIMVSTEDISLSELELTEPAYWLRESCHGTQYSNKRIVSTKYEWKYYGKVHEFIAASPRMDALYGTQCGTLPTSIYSLHDSEFGRAFERDAELLESAIKEDPEDTRARFYLANTYRALDKREDAIIQWGARIALAGWPEEAYMSALGIAMMMEEIVKEENDEKRALSDDTWELLIEINMADTEEVEEKRNEKSEGKASGGGADAVDGVTLNKEKDKKENVTNRRKIQLSDIVTAYSEAHNILPYRQEASYYLARISRLLLNDYESSCYFAQAAIEGGPYSDSTLFADRDIYRFHIPDEVCTCGYHVPGKESVGQKKL
ncbi:hypothetical protein Ndes2437B_g06021 [Nannochloris sp. 'desiccata']